MNYNLVIRQVDTPCDASFLCENCSQSDETQLRSFLVTAVIGHRGRVAEASDERTVSTVSHRARIATAALCAAVLASFALGPQASADRDHAIPSQDEVDAAEHDVASARRSVDAIQAELAAAGAYLEELAIEAEQASERYNGALVAWREAKAEAKAAGERSAEASANAKVARDDLAGYAVAQDTTAPALTSFSTTLSSDGSHTLLRQLADADTTSRALSSRYETWSASSELADVYQAAAEDALTAADDAKQAAAEAKQAAQTAVDAQQSAVASMGAQREVLIQELAKVQDISVELATQRQTGLEERHRQRVAEQRRQEALQREREQQQQQQQQPKPATAPADDPEPDDPKPDDPEPSNPAPTVPSTSPNPPAPSGGAAAAIRFARAQIGEPYVWGADGPSSWDCSGLTMGAWAAAGVYLPHYSVAQYAATTPIRYTQLKPGDLIFWASNPDDPGTIFHVGLYIGGGQMIHAPRTGQDVQVQDVWYWESPDFFGRP
jgi:cell wall-associated NlpC family hydrolase